MLLINSTQNVIVTVYAYYDGNLIDGTAVAFPRGNSNDPKVYSGRGTGYFLTFNHRTVTTNNLPYVYTTNNNNISQTNTNETVPITLVGTNVVASISASDVNLRNLENWCAQNYHTITLKNSVSAAKTVYGYVGANALGNTQVINRGGVVKSCALTNNAGYYTWRWCKVNLAANESCTFDFQQILASYGAAATVHKWELG